MRTIRTIFTTPLISLSYSLMILLIFSGCSGIEGDKRQQITSGLKRAGLDPVIISASDFYRGIVPVGFSDRAGASYKPSLNEDPGIPAQCWIETGYGTQNACKYCHTDYLTSIEHGNAYPIGEDQILFSFPTPRLNNILWQNIIYPERVLARLAEERIDLPAQGDNDYIREDNWLPAYRRGRSSNNGQWINHSAPEGDMKLFPDLNPEHLFPYNEADPTSGGTHGYIGPEGFVRDENNGYTGWRAINFFPYAIFTPLTGSVSGIYIRLPEKFRNRSGSFSVEVYKDNLELLEANIKNSPNNREYYYGDAGDIAVQKGFYPEGTEFAHPLHYVDLNADGEHGAGINGIADGSPLPYEFPGTRSKRIKEIRYMYKWKDVGLEDIAPDDGEGEEDEEVDGDEVNETEESFEYYIGREGEGWVDSGTGWILAGFIENREGELRTQTTEELAQCVGCHAKVGNTIDGVWSFQRKLPGTIGWSDMNYGEYRESEPDRTLLNDYIHSSSGMGEMGYFLHTVVGADLYGLMPGEIADELKEYTVENNLEKELGLRFPLDEILDDEFLKDKKREEREPRLLERQKVMRHYSRNFGYLQPSDDGEEHFIKGSVLFPSQETMDANIRGYRLIVLDQSYNLGKDIFGSVNDNVPFTFRSDGEVPDSDGRLIPAGEVIYSRPWDSDGVGYTPTGIVKVNDQGFPVDAAGNPVDLQNESDRAEGHVTNGGTFDLYYNPVLSGKVVRSLASKGF